MYQKSTFRLLPVTILIAAVIFSAFDSLHAQVKMDMERAKQLYVSKDPKDHPPADYERDINRKKEIDRRMREACEGSIDYDKITYRSTIDGMEIPCYIFQPLKLRGNKGHAAIIWLHGGVHGNLGLSYFPFIRQAVERGYVVLAPEYRGSTGYGKEHHNAIDYGGYEIDDCISAWDYMKDKMPHVDPDRVGMYGLSHGGMITANTVFREEHPIRCGAAIVPVTNYVFRLAYKGPYYQRWHSTQKRVQGLPFEKREIYIERSPVYNVHKLQVPLLVHIATNDQDVNFVECEMLVEAMKVKKPNLSETKIYTDPVGGHVFSLQYDPETLKSHDTPWQRDSWNRVWNFFEWNLRPYEDKSKE